MVSRPKGSWPGWRFLLANLAVCLGCIGPAGSAESRPPLLIAHTAPTTGRFALHAEADRRGVEMAIDEFNARGGVLGRELVLISRNPTLNEAQAAQVAEELITRNRIAFMVGAISSGVAASMSRVAQKYGVIFINTNSSAPSEATGNAHRSKFVFDANGANFNWALLSFSLGRRSEKRVVLLTEDNVFGRSNAQALRSYVAELGGRVVSEVVTPESLPDPAAILRQVAATPADVVAVSISGDNQIKLFSNLDPKVLEEQFWISGEVDWEELYPAPGLLRPLFGTTWAWNLKTPGTADFVARYRARYGNSRLPFPGDVTHAAYLATRALLKAIERAGTTESHALIRQLENYRESARERMQNDAAYMNPASHHVQQSIYIARWNPAAKNPEEGIEILGSIPPERVFYIEEQKTRLEPLGETPNYKP